MRSELFLGGGKPIYPRKEMGKNKKKKQKEEQDSAISSANRNRKGKWMARCSACNETTRPTLLGIKKKGYEDGSSTRASVTVKTTARKKEEDDGFGAYAKLFLTNIQELM
jgi:hypothetical protein